MRKERPWLSGGVCLTVCYGIYNPCILLVQAILGNGSNKNHSPQVFCTPVEMYLTVILWFLVKGLYMKQYCLREHSVVMGMPDVCTVQMGSPESCVATEHLQCGLCAGEAKFYILFRVIKYQIDVAVATTRDSAITDVTILIR